jgi:hypothetical protein
MPFTDEVVHRGLDAAGKVARTALLPWGGAEAFLDAYESALRTVTNAQLSAARSVEFAPARSLLASSAHLTRDLGATHLSGLRWFLDL